MKEQMNVEEDGAVLSFCGENERDSGSVTIRGTGVISMSHGICEAIKNQFPNDRNFMVELRVSPHKEDAKCLIKLLTKRVTGCGLDTEALIQNLCRARKKATEEKRAFRELAAEMPCTNDTSEKGTSPCYCADLYEDAWCGNCRNKTLGMRKYHSASAASGAALRAVLRHGKKWNTEKKTAA